ncbi:MAG: hypothetical protein MHM6MM_003422 [Cercozoa sp. M6MM]
MANYVDAPIAVLTPGRQLQSRFLQVAENKLACSQDRLGTTRRCDPTRPRSRHLLFNSSYIRSVAVHAATDTSPSQIVSAPWLAKGELPRSDNNNNIVIGCSIEPESTLADMVAQNARQQEESAAQLAIRVAENLFQFLRSFESSEGYITVPTDIVDRWLNKFRRRYLQDASFMK